MTDVLNPIVEIEEAELRDLAVLYGLGKIAGRGREVFELHIAARGLEEEDVRAAARRALEERHGRA